LAIFQYPPTIDLLRQFLKEQNFGGAITAASTLIEEGTPVELELVESLLDDPDSAVQLQAAMVLGAMTQDERALFILETAFDRVDREMKIQILERIAAVGSKKNLPFLLKQMQDPYQAIRILAASALITSLNH
jgi:HEAT repeat protein